jgi:processive 1,2-diacylglycerol beta-glucosyltransferase
MMRRILKFKPDYIICSHFLPAEILNYYKSKKDFKIPVSVIVTDFSLHWIYVNAFLENYFVNCTEVKNLLISRGVKSESVHITGCPVYPEFGREYTEEERNALRIEHGFPIELPIFLVMMGGNGAVKMKRLCEILLERFPEYGIIAMAGTDPRNIEALQIVEKVYPGRLLTVAFTDKVAQYLAISDIIITKPGGISTSECIAMKKPMIIINPIPGQEERNVDYLIERGIITKAYNVESLNYREILPSSARISHISEQLESISMPRAGYDILDIALNN